MEPKRARPTRNNEARSSREHERLSAEEKGKALIEEQQEEAAREWTIARATQEVDHSSLSFKLTLHICKT